MKIGQYYKLPDGRKGLYVGHNGALHFYSYYDSTFKYYQTEKPFTEEYREPRVFEDEVLVVRDGEGCETYLVLAKHYRGQEILARMPFKLPEGEGL